MHLITAATLMAAMATAACAPKGPIRGRTFGTVTMDGTPLPDGTVRFFALTGEIGSHAAISNGHYDLPPERGLSAGKYRVEISLEKATGRKVPDRDAGPGAMKDEVVEAIPPKYNRDSTLMIDFDPAANVPHDFALITK